MIPRRPAAGRRQARPPAFARLAFACVVLAIAGCGPAPDEAPADVSVGAARHTTAQPLEGGRSAAAPNATAPPGATPRPPPEATLLAGLRPTRTPDTRLVGAADWNLGIGAVGLVSLGPAADGAAEWLAYTRGARMLGDRSTRRQDHVVALFRQVDDTWHEAGRVTLRCPDRLTSVEPVGVTSDRRWFVARGEVDVHGRCFHLLSLSGATLASEIDHATEGPDRSRVEDVNADGVADVILDAANPYVLCYACGTRVEAFDIRYWDGERFVSVNLAPLDADVPPEVREPVNAAVALARAGLWKSAATTLRRASQAWRDDPEAVWMVRLIEVNAAARADHARKSDYPLLAQLFLGDYSGAIAGMRRFEAAELFSSNPPLVDGTVARTWEPNLVDWIERTTSAALDAQPDLAEAYFIRGWARHLKNPLASGGLSDIQRAAAFAPRDTLYTAGAEHLARERRRIERLRAVPPDS